MRNRPQTFNEHPIGAFILGMAITGFLFGLIPILYLLLTFDLGGGETFQQVQAQRSALLMFVTLLVGISLYSSWKQAKRGKRYLALGILPIPLLALSVVFSSHLLAFHQRTDFDQVVWKQADEKPLGMVLRLLEDGRLIQLTRDELYELLGQPNDFQSSRRKPPSTETIYVEREWLLILHYEDDRVVNCELVQPSMMTEIPPEKTMQMVLH